MTRIWAGPANFKSAGEWEPIDNRLEVASAGDVENAANAYDTALPDSLEDPVAMSLGGDRVAFVLRGAAGTRSVDGNEATYENALPGVDVSYAAGSSALKEELVLADAESPRSFAFDLELSQGLSPSINESGGVDVSRGGKVVAQVLRPFAVDAEGVSSDDVRYALRREAGVWVLSLDAGSEWLDAPERAWPVTVDPTTTFSELYDTYVANGTDGPDDGEDAQYGPTTYFSVSTGGDRVRRALVKFNVAGVPDNAVVTQATMNLFGDGTGQDVEVHKVSRSWTTDATWNRYDGTNTWTTPGGQFNARVEDTTHVTPSEDWYQWVVGNAVADWVADASSNHGLLLKAPTESTGTNGNGAGFYGALSSGNVPYMDVEWEDAIGVKPQYGFDTMTLSDRSQLKVNLATGNLVYIANDVAAKGVGSMDLAMNRVYNSRSGWGTHGLSWALSAGDGVWMTDYNGSQTATIHGSTTEVWRFAKDASGNWVSPPALNATLTDVSGGRKLMFHGSGETWFFDTSKGGSLAWKEDKNGHRITYGLDANGLLTKVTDTQGRDYTVTRNGTSGYITAITDAAYPGSSRVWGYDYDDLGSDPDRLLSSYTDPAGITTSYQYDPGTSDIKKITDGRGNEIRIAYTYAYDNGNYPRVESITRVTASSTDVDPKRSFEYDLANRKTTITDEGGNATAGVGTDGKWIHYWNKDLQIIKVTNPKGYDTTTTFNSNADTTQLVGQAQSGSGITAAPIDLTYSSDGNNNPTGGQLAGDGSNREQFSSTFYGGSQTFPTSGGGSAASPATGQYRTATTTDANGSTLAFDYDAAGNLSQVKDTSAVIQASLAYTTAADAPKPKGLLKTATDGNGNTTTYAYDNSGNLTSVKPPLVGAINPGGQYFTYDTEGRVRTKTDERGQVLTYAYDKLDRVCATAGGSQSSLSCTSSPTAPWVKYAYDANGNLTGRSSSTGTVAGSSSFTYDELNRRTAETINGATTSYQYDDNSNLTKLTDSGGDTAYTYDAIDRPSTVDPPATGDNVTITYLDSGAIRTRRLTYSNGAKAEQDYTLSGKLQAVRVYSSSGGTPLKTLSYDYRRSGAGQAETQLRLAETQKTGSTIDKVTTYAYDNLNRLCWATTKSVATPACGTVPSGSGGNTYSYQWDNASNRKITKVDLSGTVTQTAYGFDAANELCWSTTGSFGGHACSPTPSGATSYSRDNAGNRTSGGYTYDAFNRFTGTSGTALAYADISNNELLGDGSTTLVNSPLGLMASTTGGSTTRYVRMPSGELLGERTNAGTRYAIRDALGSTRWLLNGNTIDKAYDYTPDGVVSSSGSGADSLIRFAGGHRTNAGLYHFGARYYDPGTARWTQRDPVFPGVNAYAYASGNPTNSTDPSGLLPNIEEQCRNVLGIFGPVCDVFPATAEAVDTVGEKARDCADSAIISASVGGVVEGIAEGDWRAVGREFAKIPRRFGVAGCASTLIDEVVDILPG